MEESKPGVYVARVCQNKSGSYSVNVSVNGEDITASSIELNVVPGNNSSLTLTTRST